MDVWDSDSEWEDWGRLWNEQRALPKAVPQRQREPPPQEPVTAFYPAPPDPDTLLGYEHTAVIKLNCYFLISNSIN